MQCQVALSRFPLFPHLVHWLPPVNFYLIGFFSLLSKQYTSYNIQIYLYPPYWWIHACINSQSHAIGFTDNPFFHCLLWHLSIIFCFFKLWTVQNATRFSVRNCWLQTTFIHRNQTISFRIWSYRINSSGLCSFGYSHLCSRAIAHVWALHGFTHSRLFILIRLALLPVVVSLVTTVLVVFEITAHLNV